MDEDPQAGYRVSDAERDLVIRRLQEHCATGRLSLDELTERVAEVQSARTSADLAAVTGDLPVEQPAHPGIRDPAFRTHAVVALAFMSALTGLWLLTSDLTPRPEDDGQSYYWPFWLDLTWGMVLFLHYLRAAGRLALPRWTPGRAPPSRIRPARWRPRTRPARPSYRTCWTGPTPEPWTP
jgi:hypothetical protein